MKQKIRVVTYNIHKGRGLDRRMRIERIGHVLEAIHADIVALQEVVSHEGRSLEDHQADYLAQRFGYFQKIGETRKHQGGVYGNVTLSRWEFAQSKFVDLSVPGREERGVLRTDIRLGHHVVHVFNTHLGVNHSERRMQAARLLKALQAGGPRIVLGDFNEWTHGLVTETLRREFSLTDLRVHLPRRRTYPSGLPLLSLDHIYYDPHFRAESAHFHGGRTALIASDHLPLVADLWLDTSAPATRGVRAEG